MPGGCRAERRTASTAFLLPRLFFSVHLLYDIGKPKSEAWTPNPCGRQRTHVMSGPRLRSGGSAGLVGAAGPSRDEGCVNKVLRFALLWRVQDGMPLAHERREKAEGHEGVQEDFLKGNICRSSGTEVIFEPAALPSLGTPTAVHSRLLMLLSPMCDFSRDRGRLRRLAVSYWARKLMSQQNKK